MAAWYHRVAEPQPKHRPSTQRGRAATKSAADFADGRRSKLFTGEYNLKCGFNDEFSKLLGQVPLTNNGNLPSDTVFLSHLGPINIVVK